MQIGHALRSLLMFVLCVQLITLGGMPMAQAGMIRTDEYAAAVERDERVERVQGFLAEERVQAQLEVLGVDPSEAADRVAALTDAELAQLDSRIDDMPAGAGVLTVLGVMFVILLILELVGITNIFVAI